MADNDELARMYRAPSARVEDFGPSAGRPRALWLGVSLGLANLIAGLALLVFFVFSGAYLLFFLVFVQILGEWWLVSMLVPFGLLVLVLFRRNWARLWWVSLMLASWLSTLFERDLWLGANATGKLCALLLFFIDVFVAYLLFSKSVGRWFATRSAAEEAVL